MSEKRISHVVGKGSLTHNNRTFIAKNVDRSRTEQNVVLVQIPLADAYSKLFDSAVKRYNSKQSRKCRYIKPDYFTHLFNHKICDYTLTANNKQKSFYEDLIQVGDMHDTGCGTPDAETAKQCLIEYYEHYIKCNQNFYVFNAVIHMDEATPHLHIDYIPIGHYNKGLDTRNAMAQALDEMGYHGVNAAVKWREHERDVFTEICKSHGFEIAAPNKSRGYNFTCDEYRDIQEEKKRLTAELEPLREMELAAEAVNVKGSKIPLSSKVIVSADEMEELTLQKRAAVVQALDNQHEREANEQYKESLDKREAEIAEKEELSMKEQAKRTKELDEREKAIEHNEISAANLLESAKDKNYEAKEFLYRAELDFSRAQGEREFQRDLNTKYNNLNNEYIKEQRENAKNKSILRRIRKALNISEDDTNTDIAEKCRCLMDDNASVTAEYKEMIGSNDVERKKSVSDMLREIKEHFMKQLTTKEEEISCCRQKISFLAAIKEEYLRVVLAFNTLVYAEYNNGLSGKSKALANGISRFIDRCFDKRGELETINKSVICAEINQDMKDYEKENQPKRTYNDYQR